MKERYLLLFIILHSGFSAFCQNQASFGAIRPGMKDRLLEQQAIKAANRRAEACMWPETYCKAVIISDAWEPYKDKHGRLKGRKIHMELLAKMPNGRCAMTDFTFRQKFLPDETFSEKLLYDSVGDIVYVACEQ